MRRRARNSDNAPGQDSFLDIVANLVGILIILIMVVGVRAKDAMLAVPASPESDQPVDVETPRAAARAVRADINQLQQKLARQQLEIAYRERERDNILVMITAADQEIAQQRDQLDDAAREAFDAESAVSAAERELEDLKRSHQVVENMAAPVSVIQHLPTPMAKTVFGKELHFRLLGGKLTYVPWNEMIAKLKAEAPEKVWKLKDAPRITEVVGPIQGFRLQYTLKRVDFSIETRVGTAVQQGVQLEVARFIPVSDDLGQPLDVALAAGSQIRSLFDSHDPRHTTVTVWVYPDSFNEFRSFKERLFRLGFLTAGRPLRDGDLISGSPEGARSAAQ